MSNMRRLGLSSRWSRTVLVAIFTLSALPTFGQQEQTSYSPPATAASPPDLKPDANGSLSQEQMQQLMRSVADKDVENDKHLRNYTYIERDEEHRLDGKGNVKSTEITTYEVMELYGEQVRRLTEKDDKPLDAKEAAKEDEKIQKMIDKRKAESEDERQKREQKDEKEEEEGRKFVREIADAYNFRLVGTESLQGRDAWVIDAEPRPGYQPHLKYANLLPKFRGRVWIDKEDAQWAKLDESNASTQSPSDYFSPAFTKGRASWSNRPASTMKSGCPSTSQSKSICAWPCSRNTTLSKTQPSAITKSSAPGQEL